MTTTSSNKTKSQSTSSNAIISVDDEEKELPESKEAPAPLTHETSEQDEINKQTNIENEILVVLYKKKELNQMMGNDQKEIKARQANLEKLKKKLDDLKLSRKLSKKFRLNRKRKLDVLDEITRKKVTG